MMMDLLIPVNIISVNCREELSVHNDLQNRTFWVSKESAIYNIQKIKNKHQILNMVGINSLNINDEKNINLITQSGKIYCVIRNAKKFEFDDLKFSNILIKQQYIKICSFAFLLGIGKDCFLKNNQLFMYNINDQKIDNIVPNILRFLSPKELMKVVDDIYKILDLFEKHNFISNNVKLIIKDQYQSQLINDMF
jgi:hypothetical protein